jgi:hypothetical protein
VTDGATSKSAKTTAALRVAHGTREGGPKRLVDPATLTIPSRLLPGTRGNLTLDLGDIFGDSKTGDG